MRLPRLPKILLPFALVHTEPDPVARRADRERRAARVAEQAGLGFARLTILPVIVVAAWLVPGLPLLLGGVFDPVPELLIAAPLATALAVNLLHRVPGQWPATLPAGAPQSDWRAALGIAGTVATAAGFGAWQLALNSPSVIAARMPGAYFQVGYWIAQHGSLPIPGSLGAFGGAHAGLRLASIGFAAQGHSVVPKVTPGLPMLLAGGFWTSGTGGGAVIGPVLGALAVLSFAGLVGRLAGRQWAPAGALVLALTLPELYTSRDAFSETAVQVLLFGGLSLVIDALTVSKAGAPVPVGPRREPASAAGSGGANHGPAVSLGKAGSDETAHATRPGATDGADDANTAPLPAVPAPASGPFSRLRAIRDLSSRAANALTAEAILAGLGGLALGLTSLLSLTSLPYLVPVIPVAGVLLAARRTVAVLFSLGLVAGCAYGMAGAYLLARPPAGPQTMPLKVIGLVAGGLVLLTLAAVLLARVPRVRRLAGGFVGSRPLRWLPGLASAAVVAGLVWFAIRPYLQTVRGVLGPGVVRYVATLQRIAGLRVDPTRLYWEDTLYWVIWYAGIATVLLGGFGAAILIRRCVRDLLSRRDASLNWALPLVIILGGTAAVLWQPFTVPDQPWASRRLVPVVIPGLILLATWAAAWLTLKARQRGAGAATAAVVGAFSIGAMLLPSVSTSFGFGLTHAGTRGGLQPTAGGLAQHSVGAHEADAVRGVCSVIGRSSAVLIVDRRIAADFSQAIRGMCGVPVAWVGPKAPASTVQAALAGIARSGRRAVLLGDSPQETGLYGGAPTLIMNLVTTQYPHELTQPPGAPWRARYRIWMTSPGAPNAGV
ncbi:MAG TPA: hypothetical protein VFW16_08095 [Streptosporangiaceae bacterium]|nr:hypothetical protein [Streptosporangiaceae bacterium]